MIAYRPLSKLIVSFTLAIAFMLLTAMAFSPVASDVTPPTLIKWQITPTLIYANIAPSPITITVWFSDDISGLTDGYINDAFVNTSNVSLSGYNRGKVLELKPSGVTSGNLISGTATNGIYQDIFYVSASDIGEWELKFFGKDDVGNSIHYNLYLEGFYSDTVPIYPVSVVVTSSLKFYYFPLLLK